MKHTEKRGLSILMALAMTVSLLAGLTVTAAAEMNDAGSTLALTAEAGLQTETSRTVRVKNLSGDAASVRLVLAAYDAAGCMLAVNAKQDTLEAEGYRDITVEYEQGLVIGKLRVFALDPTTGSPLCQAMEIQGPFDLMIDETRRVSGGSYQNVTIAPSVGDGDVSLKGVTISGDLIVQGGGSNSVTLEECTVNGRVILDKAIMEESTQLPRLELTNTPISTVKVQQPAIIEATDASSPVDTVKAKADVEVRGADTTVSNLTIPAGTTDIVTVTVSGGTIGTVAAESDVTVNTAESSFIETITANASVTVSSGTVNTISVPKTDSGHDVTVTVSSDAAVGEVAVSSANGASIINNGTVFCVSAADAAIADKITSSGASSTPTASAHIHSWDAGSEALAPTCTAAGTKTCICQVDGCGATKTVAVPALGHDFEASYQSNESGHWHVCSRCGEHGKKAPHVYVITDCAQAAVCTVCAYEKPAGDHMWGEGVVTKAPTFTEPGVKTYTCTSCSTVWNKDQRPLATDSQLALIQTAGDKGLLTYLTLNDLGDITRLEMTKLLAAFLELEPEEDMSIPYTDCAGLTGHEWSIIRRIVNRDIIAPYDNNEFRPNAVVTRGAVAEIFSRALNQPVTSWTKEFSDVAGIPFQNAINNLYNLGLITGTSETTFSPAESADKETALTWLINGKDWTDPRTPVSAVTGASFVKTPAAIQLEIEHPSDMSDIEKFRLELKDSDGYWVDCGTFLGNVPIFGDGLNGTYNRIRITSIPKDPSTYLPATFKMDCMLTVTNTADSAPDDVAFSTVTTADSETGYCVEVQGLSADTDQAVVELAEEPGGRGLRNSMAGNRFFDVTSSGKSVSITVFADYPSSLIPDGYYRVLEVKQASVTNSSTASLTVNTRGNWAKVPALGSITYEPVSDLHFTQRECPVLTWTIPASDPSSARYRVYLSTDGGQTWIYAHSVNGWNSLPPYLFKAGNYNAVKVSTVVNGREVASCVSTDLYLDITRNDSSASPLVTLTLDASGGYLCTITGLSPLSNYTLFFGDGTGNYNSSMGFTSDGNGCYQRLMSNLSGSEFYHIQKYSACSVDASGKTASFTVSALGGWKQV